MQLLHSGQWLRLAVAAQAHEGAVVDLGAVRREVEEIHAGAKLSVVELDDLELAHYVSELRAADEARAARVYRLESCQQVGLGLHALQLLEAQPDRILGHENVDGSGGIAALGGQGEGRNALWSLERGAGLAAADSRLHLGGVQVKLRGVLRGALARVGGQRDPVLGRLVRVCGQLFRRLRTRLAPRRAVGVLVLTALLALGLVDGSLPLVQGLLTARVEELALLLGQLLQLPLARAHTTTLWSVGVVVQ